MKKYLYLILFSSLGWSCGGGGDDTPPPTVNNAPTIPTLALPTDGFPCIDNVLNFQWNASTDPDGGTITYQIQVAINAQFSSPLTHDVTVTATNRTLTLEKGITYYWRVKAIDNKNLSSAYSTTFSFYTEPVATSNNLPDTPVLVTPVLNSVATGVDVDLQWTGNDKDVSDTLTYDIYFDTVNPPVTMVGGGNQSTTTLNVPLSPLTDYYWKVVVKDNKGGQTIGQVWNFKTD